MCIRDREEFVWATSWGVSTRLIGAVILTHGDDKGLRLPPKIAPVQMVIIPISKNDEDEKAIKLYLDSTIKSLKMEGVRIHLDWTNNTPGYKFNEWEMKGVPLRMEVGPRDIENDKVVLVRRDLGEKLFLSKIDILSIVPELLEKIQNNLFTQAKKFREVNTCLLYTSPSPRDATLSRMPSSA